MLLPASLSKPSYVYLVLFLAQLLFIVVWISSIQIEQHVDGKRPHEGFALPAASGGGSASSVNPKILDAMVARRCEAASDAAKLQAPDCGTRITNAIQQLEALKTEMHLSASPSTAPAATAVATPCPACPSPASSSPTSSSSSSRLPLLIIGIPSMPRAADYLTPTLQAIDRQLVKDERDPMYHAVHVFVMNNVAPDQPGGALPAHTSFLSNSQLYQNRLEFHFLANDHAIPDPAPQNEVEGTADRPGKAVRKQTRDIARLMREVEGKSTYYMAMEDDFELCPNTLNIIQHSLRKGSAFLTASPAAPLADWISMKFSYGFNGFLVRNNRDLQQLAAYLLLRERERPPDHTVVEWSCAEKPEAREYVGARPHLTYRYNLFTHLGRVSSLRHGGQGEYPGCFHRMNTEVVFPVDQYDEAKCAHDDMSPCLEESHPAWTPPYGVEPKLIVEGNKK
jgi:hypothetical protein